MRLKRASLHLTLCFTLISFSFIQQALLEIIDNNGYIAYCPCMGRFGNQADHFLGALGFAHGLNRSLILPPWVEYRNYAPKSTQVPFATYFKVNAIAKYHRVITMERFMEELAPQIWPPEERTVFCFMARGATDDCNAKEGNPFGPFWDTFNISFVKSELYSPLHYDLKEAHMASGWNERYPPSKYPVLAFTGAPASFPVKREYIPLHKYLRWSEEIEIKAKIFIQKHFPQGPFVGLHFRNGVDWERACTHVEQSPTLFSAPQCVGYHNEHGKATPEMCNPTLNTILSQTKNVVKKTKATGVFVASDDDHMIPKLTKGLKKFKVNIVKLDENDPHVDLAILGRSSHFIANCISSFSAFAVRERMANKLPYSFWAFPSKTANVAHDEF